MLLSLASKGALRCILQSSKPLNFPTLMSFLPIYRPQAYSPFLLLPSPNLERFLSLNTLGGTAYRKAAARSYMISLEIVL